MKVLTMLVTVIGLVILPVRYERPAPVEVVPVTRIDPVDPVLQAMKVLAKTDKTTPEKLMADPRKVAQIIVDQATAARVDPLLLTTIAWTETRFRTNLKGDHGRSCGITQVRTDFKGRPTCEQLLDPAVAFAWTATHLNEISDTGGKIQLDHYNAGKYEVRIWRTVDWLRRQLPVSQA